MAASMIIEEETGTYVSTRQHPHNGYYAGDFSQNARQPDAWRALMSIDPNSLRRRGSLAGENSTQSSVASKGSFDRKKRRTVRAHADRPACARTPGRASRTP